MELDEPKSKALDLNLNDVHVINSKLKAVRSILSAKNAYTALLSDQYTQIFENPVQIFVYRLLYSTYFDLGLRRSLEQSVQAATYFLENVGSLPNTDYLSVRYEDLCNEPEEIILKILGFLRLEPKVTLAYDTLIEPRPTKLLPEVQGKYEQIRQKLQPYFAYHGYDT